MEQNSWDREEESIADCQYPAELEIFVELAICCQAVEDRQGSLCADCKCVLGYHNPCDRGECEFCGCDEIRVVCVSCDKPRTLEQLDVRRVCVYCKAYPPATIPKVRGTYQWGKNRSVEYQMSYKTLRGIAAREALRELTE